MLLLLFMFRTSNIVFVESVRDRLMPLSTGFRPLSLQLNLNIGLNTSMCRSPGMSRNLGSEDYA